MGDEIEPGRLAGGEPHIARVDAFALPQLEKGTAETVVADRADDADPRARPRRRDGAIGNVAAEAEEITGLFGLGLVEFAERLAEAEDVSGHGFTERNRDQGFAA